MIRTLEWKYIEAQSEEDAFCKFCHVIHGGIRELYDLRKDPDETLNLIDQYPDIVKHLKKQLHDHICALELKASKMNLSGRIKRLKAILRSKK